MKIHKKCSKCNGTNVSKDAWISWNEEMQEWEIMDIFDESFCFDCEQNTTIVDEEYD